jgi:hypothetical protein
MPDASTQTPAERKKIVKVAVPPVMETQTSAGLGPTRKPIAATTQHKYEQAITRIKKAKLDLEEDVDKVIAWVKEQGGDSAQKTYYSAIKWELGKLDKPEYMPRAYQAEIDRLYGLANKKADEQELTPAQVENFVPYPELLAVQQRLAAKEDKTDKEWKDYLVASLYTLQPPVRADYGAVQVVGKRMASREGNQLVWGQKRGAYFIFKEYKTKSTYGVVEVRVSPALHAVITEWFGHLGKRPKWLLGRSITPNDLLAEIHHAFRSTRKDIGINLLRHAYIKHHFAGLTTIKQKEELARMMLHSKDKQEQYNSQNV